VFHLIYRLLISDSLVHKLNFHNHLFQLNYQILRNHKQLNLYSNQPQPAGFLPKNQINNNNIKIIHILNSTIKVTGSNKIMALMDNNTIPLIKCHSIRCIQKEGIIMSSQEQKITSLTKILLKLSLI